MWVLLLHGDQVGLHQTAGCVQSGEQLLKWSVYVVWVCCVCTPPTWRPGGPPPDCRLCAEWNTTPKMECLCCVSMLCEHTSFMKTRRDSTRLQDVSNLENNSRNGFSRGTGTLNSSGNIPTPLPFITFCYCITKYDTRWRYKKNLRCLFVNRPHLSRFLDQVEVSPRKQILPLTLIVLEGKGQIEP